MVPVKTEPLRLPVYNTMLEAARLSKTLRQKS